jgi:hypothetical protein
MRHHNVIGPQVRTFPRQGYLGASRTVRCMKDCHANLFVGLTAPKRFFGVRPTCGDPIHPSITIFMSRGAPFLRGMGIFSENDLRELL